MSRIRTYSDSTPLLLYCRIITAAEAMRHAVPQLDLILTPNGFGIVSNQNVIPASKERIERLLLSLEKQRDDALAVILTMLPDAHHWTASEQFNYFAATMFTTLDIVNSIRLAKGNVFAEWKQSDTAKLFEDHGYKNKKQAGGYFF